MGAKTDLAGKAYGRWTVIREAGRDRHRKVLWLCRCTCGTEKTVVGDKLRRGLTKSCGCLSAELTAERNIERNTTHGLRQHRLYATWRNMLDRCFNPNAKGYATYSVRGVCPEWSNRETGFEAFLADMESTWAEGLTLDRVDNDGPYAPWNCRWATRVEQQRNTSRTRFLTYAGRTMCLADWAEDTGLNENTIRTRLDDLGWPVSRALTTEVTPGRLAGAQDCEPSHVRAAVETGTGPCGHDDYHDPHEWADRPGIWCPGISYADALPDARLATNEGGAR